jgi:ribonuclease G
MSKELVISSNSHETKVAILEDDQLVEIYFQRSNEYSLAGSIHKGRVTRVLPGMQSAFVDLGLERDTFLYVSDFFDENGEEFEKIPTDEKTSQRPGGRPDRGDQRGEQRADSGRPKPAATPVIPPETHAEEGERAEAEPLAAAAAPPPVAEKPHEPENRDPRGRRSRRRRTRGKGFPESKYASDLPATPSNTAEPAAFDEPETSAAEVFLLPGESLRKYSARTNVSEAEPPEAQVYEQEESQTAETAADTEPVLSAPPLATAFPDPSFIASSPFPSSILRNRDIEETADISPLADINEPVELAADETAPVDTEPADTASGPDLEDAFVSDGADEVSFSGSDSEMDDAIEDAIEAATGELTDAAAPEVEGAMPSEREGEPGSGGPVTASVRDQGGRYQHRGARRMRRRRGDREKSPEGIAGVPAPLPAAAAEPVAERQSGRDRPPLPSITELLKEGQEIIVQIAKEPLGQKGARITSHIALPGRYVVYMPTVEHLGVSRKIASDEERQRLKRILQTHRVGISGGFIIRTAGEGHTEDEIAHDMLYLNNLWLDMRQKAEKRPAPVLLHHDLDIVQRILRDQLSDMFKSIWVDSEEIYESVVRFMQRFQPALVGRVKLYTRQVPIFEAFNVAQEIEKALRPKVWLKSGGYIVINQTEALVAIDVNTGKYVGKSNRLEDTITKTNTEAVKEIVRQIRLRDLGGIIVVDFIDMDERKNRQKVMQTLEEAMRADRAPYKILQFNDFGLVAITRKRVKQSLERTLCSPCPTCEGAGYVKNVSTIVGEILQEAGKLSSSIEGKNVILRTHPDVAKHLKSSRNVFLEEIEEVLGRPVLVTSDPSLHPDKFDLAW